MCADAPCPPGPAAVGAGSARWPPSPSAGQRAGSCATGLASASAAAARGAAGVGEDQVGRDMIIRNPVLELAFNCVWHYCGYCVLCISFTFRRLFGLPS